MFDFDTTKLLLIGVVALVAIPPKDLPRVIRQVGQAVGKVRRMAAEFQGQVMEALKEAELDDLKKEITSIADSAKAEVKTITDAAKVNFDIDPVADAQREMTKAIEAEPVQPASLLTAQASGPEDIYARATGQVGPPMPPLDEAALNMPDLPAAPLVTHDLIAAQAGLAVEDGVALAPSLPSKAVRTVDLRRPDALETANRSAVMVPASPAGHRQDDYYDPPPVAGALPTRTAVVTDGGDVPPDVAAQAGENPGADNGVEPSERVPYRKRVAYAAPLPGRAARAARRES